MKRLTPVMIETLRRIQGGARVVWVLSTSMADTSGWLVDGVRCNGTVEALKDRGLLQEAGRDWKSARLELTEAGRTYPTERAASLVVKWKTDNYSTAIRRCVFRSETDEFLIGDNGQRESKSSRYDHYHDTWDAARTHLLERAQKDADAHMKAHKAAVKSVQKLKTLREPSDSSPATGND